jgi:hypothetical protein
MIESNESRLRSLSDEYAWDSAAKVPVMNVPGVAQPAQTDFQYSKGVPTEQVPTEAAMRAPAVSQPTQVALKATEQVPIDAALSEPAVSEPTQAVSGESETIETVHMFTVMNDTQRAVYLGVRGIPTREGSGHRRVLLVTGRVRRPGTPTAAGLGNLIRGIEAPCKPQARPPFPSNSLKQDPGLFGSCTRHFSLFNLSGAYFSSLCNTSSSHSPVSCTSPDPLRINLDGKVGPERNLTILLLSAVLVQWLRTAVVEKLTIRTASTTLSGQDWQCTIRKRRRGRPDKKFTATTQVAIINAAWGLRLSRSRVVGPSQAACRTMAPGRSTFASLTLIALSVVHICMLPLWHMLLGRTSTSSVHAMNTTLDCLTSHTG